MKQNEVHQYKISDITSQVKSPRIKALISYYLYQPSPVKIKNTVSKYANNNSIKIYGCIMQDKIEGLIVIKKLSSLSRDYCITQ